MKIIKINNYISIFITTTLIGCGSHNLTPSNINFKSIQKQQENIYKINFSSELDLFSPKFEENHLGIVGRHLLCSLSDDNNFDIEHVIKFTLDGLIEKNSTDSNGAHNLYAEALFSENKPKWTSSRRLTNNEIIGFLSKKESIPCMARMTIYLKTPYYSKIMYIPTKDILIEINHH